MGQGQRQRAARQGRAVVEIMTTAAEHALRLAQVSAELAQACLEGLAGERTLTPAEIATMRESAQQITDAVADASAQAATWRAIVGPVASHK